jgi:glycosyltransferase involved in cell wall biosynthesis
MSEKPLVSVIIPVFNLEPYLAEAVDSVLDQTCRDLEVILVDDGSTDRSREIIERCRHQAPDRVRAVFREHAGAASARNAGIAMAGGAWIAFLDGDDDWKPDKLRIQLEEARKNPGINLLSSAAEILGQGGLLSGTIPDGQDLKLELLRKGCFITLSSVLLRRELLQDTRFDERLPGAQDLDLYLRLADRIRYRFIPEPLIRYRIRENAISDPQTTRYAQLDRHYRIMKREMGKMAIEDPRLFKQCAWPTKRRITRSRAVWLPGHRASGWPGPRSAKIPAG